MLTQWGKLVRYYICHKGRCSSTTSLLLYLLVLLMVQKSCTSWGWKFIPLFTRFYVPGGCLGFLPSTVVLHSFYYLSHYCYSCCCCCCCWWPLPLPQKSHLLKLLMQKFSICLCTFQKMNTNHGKIKMVSGSIFLSGQYTWNFWTSVFKAAETQFPCRSNLAKMGHHWAGELTEQQEVGVVHWILQDDDHSFHSKF